MSEPTQIDGGHGWMVGVLVFVGALIVLMVVLAGIGLGRSTMPSNAVVPRAGAVAVPTSTSLPARSATRTPQETPLILSPGRRVAAISPDGAGTRVYGDSRLDAMVLDIYRDGAAFEILEPGSEVREYPVQQNGRTWYRVRATDGLVGWVIVDRLVPLE